MYPETQHGGTIFPSSSSARSPAQLLGSASMLGQAFAGDLQEAKRPCALLPLEDSLHKDFHCSETAFCSLKPSSSSPESLLLEALAKHLFTV